MFLCVLYPTTPAVFRRSTEEASQDQRGVLAAEAEVVGHRDVDGPGPRGVGHVVEVASVVGVVEGHRRRHEPVAYREQADDRLGRAPGGDEVARHALRARYLNAKCVVAEGMLDGQGLDRV